MKKLLVMFAIAGALVACNNSSDGSATNDSANKAADTNSTMMSAPDTTHMSDTTSHMSDTVKMSGDTTKK